MTRARLPRFLCVATIAALAAAASPAVAGPIVFSEPFSGATTVTSPWIFGIAANSSTTYPSYGPCLTASTTTGIAGQIPGCPSGAVGGAGATLPDPLGQGALRLTDNTNFQSGFIIYNTAFNSSQGLIISFNWYTYHGSGTYGGDGLSFFLIDGSQSPTNSGAVGGALGYAQRNTGGTQCCDAPGIAGGYVGVGFDESGFWSQAALGRVGGPGQITESVALRGAAGTSYAYLVGYQSAGVAASLPQPIDTFTATTRGAVAPRLGRIVLSNGGVIRVDIDFTGTGSSWTNVIPSTQLSKFTGQPALPSTLKFGFAGTSGNYVNIHEIGNVTVQTPLPNLAMTMTRNTSSLSAGGTASYTLNVTNVAGSGKTDNPVTVTDTLPAGMTYVSAAGTNWSCSNSGQVVTCSWTGSFKNPGSSYPSIALSTSIAPGTAGSVTNTATVDTVDDADTSNNTATDTTTVTAVPTLQLIKRITQVVSSGPTPLPGATPSTVVPTPDPSSPAGVSGTVNYPGFYPGDVVTYTVYFRNTGMGAALGPSGNGPTFTDLLSPYFTVVPGSQTFTCCSNPATSVTATTTVSGQTLQWSMNGPLPLPTPVGTAAPIQGSFSYQASLR